MNRKIAAILVVLAATLATVVAISSSVQAEVGNELHIGEIPAVITGLSPIGSNEVFTFQDGEDNEFTVTCTIGAFEGKTTANTVTQLTVTPVYSGCKSLGVSVLIKMYGCKYRWEWTDALTADWRIVECPTKNQMQIELNANCVIWFPVQGPKPHVTFQNVGSPKHITAATTVTEISYQYLGTKCPAADKAEKEDGELSGTTTVRAYKLKEEKQVQNPFSSHQYTEYVDDGKQVSLSSQ